MECKNIYIYIPLEESEAPASHNQRIQLQIITGLTKLLSRISPEQLHHHIYLFNSIQSTHIFRHYSIEFRFYFYFLLEKKKHKGTSFCLTAVSSMSRTSISMATLYFFILSGCRNSANGIRAADRHFYFFYFIFSQNQNENQNLRSKNRESKE